MAIINKEEIREYYHEYLLDIHKNWNKPGNGYCKSKSNRYFLFMEEW